MDADTEAYATKSDISKLNDSLLQVSHEMSNLKVEMAGHRSAIIYWMIGIFFGTFTLAGALLTLLLAGMYHLYGLLV